MIFFSPGFFAAGCELWFRLGGSFFQHDGKLV